MSENVDTSANSSADTSVAAANREPLILRSWPKIVLLIPTLIMALICGIVTSIYNQLPAADAGLSGVHYLGIAFLVVLAINLTMVLYDLSLRGFFVVVLCLLVLILGLILMNRAENLWSWLQGAFSVRIYANSAFYFTFAIILLFNLAIAWVITRFNYWKVEHNEIIINRGFMHEQERHPTAQARFKLVIEDVVEYAMLGCGKMVFTFGDNPTTHELPTVLRSHHKAKRLDELLGRVEVVSHS